MRQQLLRQHVARIRRVDLAVDRQREIPVRRFTDTVAGRAIPVVDERASLQCVSRSKPAGNDDAYLYAAAREKLAVPRRHGDDHMTASASAAGIRRHYGGNEPRRRATVVDTGCRDQESDRNTSVRSSPTSGMAKKPVNSDPLTAATVLMA